MNYSSFFTKLSCDELYSIDGGGDRAGLIVSGVVTVAGGIVTCCTGAVPAGVAVVAAGCLFFAAAAAY